MKRLVLILAVICITVLNFSPQIARWYHFHKAAQAVASFPSQFGLTSVTLMQCTISCNSACCTGGSLCSTLDTGRCPQTQEVSGSPAGGDGSMLLLSTSMISQAGIKSGGQVVAGCMSMTMCDSGVAAGEGGCAGSGCG